MSDDQNQDKSQKTEQPTPRRLDKAREEGQIPFSKEVGHCFMMLTFTFILLLLFPRTFHSIQNSLKNFLEFSYRAPDGGLGFLEVATHLFTEVGLALLMPTLFIMAAALAGPLVQTKFLVSMKNVKPKLSKLSPLKGITRLLGGTAWVEFGKNMLKFAVIASIAAAILWPEFSKLNNLVALSAQEALAYLMDLTLKLLGVIIPLMIVIALLDVGYQKYQFIQNLKMSLQEIKDEHKETEGDPQIKQRLRRLRQERSQRRMAQAVSDATVVLTNPTHYAVALQYSHGKMNAPRLVAKGVDHTALQIRKIAREKGVPVVENPPLTRALYSGVKEGTEIPFEYYEAVAKIMRYILKMNRKK